MSAVLVSLLVFLVHCKLKARVLKLAIKHHSEEVPRVFEWISVITFCVKGMHKKLINRAFEILKIHLVRELVKIKTAFVLVLELFIVLVFFNPLLFCCLLLLTGNVVLLLLAGLRAD